MGVRVLVNAAAKTIAGALCVSAATVAFPRPLLEQGWDALLPGTQVRGLSEKPVRGSSEKESRVYVSNVTSVSAPNALCYDFRDIPSDRPHGYVAVTLPPAGPSATELRFCFFHHSGRVRGEIRGFYRRPGQGRYGVTTAWSFLNLVLDDVFTVAVDGRAGSGAVCVGDVRPRTWHRVTIRIPPPGTAGAVGSVRLERRRADGSFAVVGDVGIPYGDLVLEKVEFFDFYGHGPCRFAFDDLVWRAAGSPAAVK